MRKESSLKGIVLCAVFMAAVAAIPAKAADAPTAPAPVPPAIEMPKPPEPPMPPAAMRKSEKSEPGFFGKISSMFSSDKDKKPKPPFMPSRSGRDGASPSPHAGGFADMMMMPRREVSREADSKSLDVARKIVKTLEQSPDRMPMHSPMLRGMSMSIVSAVAKDKPDLAEKMRKIADEVSSKVAAQHADDADNNKALAYAQMFTRAELEQLHSFYETDAGKKLVRSGGELSAREIMLNRDSDATFMDEVRTGMIKEMKKADIKIPEGLEPKK